MGAWDHPNRGHKRFIDIHCEANRDIARSFLPAHLGWWAVKTYQGTNPRPDDFDEYWDRALAEMHAIDPDVELRPAKFTVPFAECFDMFFTGVGGARVHAKLVRPKNISSPQPAVLQFHGYSGDCGDWQSKLAYAAQGYTVAALDCRGQGGLSEDVGGVKGTTFKGQIIRGLDDSPEKLLFRQIFVDLGSFYMGTIDVSRFYSIISPPIGGSGFEFQNNSEPKITRAMKTSLNALAIDRFYLVFPGAMSFSLSAKITAQSIETLNSLAF